MADETRQPSDSKNVKVSGVVDTRFTPEFLKDIKTGQEQEHTRETNRFRVEIGTLIIVLIYTTVAFWQGCSNQKAAEAAKSAADTANATLRNQKDSLMIDKRAWIAPVKAELLPKQRWMSGTPEFQVAYINTGKTPAMDVSELYQLATFPSIQLGGDSFRAFVDSPDICHGRGGAQQGRRGMLIFPGNDMGVLPTFQFPVGKDIDSGVHAVLFMECVTYKTMDVVHHTAFCYYYRNGTTHGPVWSICNAGNHAD